MNEPKYQEGDRFSSSQKGKMDINVDILCPSCLSNKIEKTLVLINEKDCDPYVYCYNCESITYLSKGDYDQVIKELIKSEYEEGDRVGVWKIESVHYSEKQCGYIYELVRYEGIKRVGLTCTISMLENYLKNLQIT